MMLAQSTSQIIGKGFMRGKEGPATGSGYDCVTIALKLLKDKGAPVSWDDSMHGKDIADWVAEFEAGNEAAFDVAIDYIVSKGVERVPVQQRTAGDILLMKLKKFPARVHSFGIDGGNGNVIIATEGKGVIGAPVNLFNIEGVFRWASIQSQ